jgi:hypothetical protein
MCRVDIQQVTQWVSFEYAVFFGALAVLFVVAWKAGISSLASLALAFFITPYAQQLTEKSVLHGLVATSPSIITFVLLLTAFYFLLRRILGEDYVYPSYLHLTFAACAALVVIAAIWVMTPALLAVFTPPSLFVTLLGAPYALFWVLGAFLVLGITRRGYLL